MRGLVAMVAIDAALGSADHLNGGPAKDQVFGNSGNNTFLARDGKRDSLDGGGGTDKARVDAIDHPARIEETF